MKCIIFCCCLLGALSLSSCYLQRPVYYVSPYNANAATYHAVPMKRDSLKTSVYAGANIYVGSANSLNSDKVFSFAGNAYQARQFGNFQAYYGADVSIGNYKVTPASEDNMYYSTADWQTLNAMAGNKFYAGVGASGGINFMHDFHWCEWRIIGAELSTHAEAGSYARFRKELPSTAADVIARSSNFSTLGFTTEVVSKTKRGSFGFQLADGLAIGNHYGNVHALDFNTQEFTRINYGYFAITFQATFHRWTGYLRIGTGTYASGAQFGTVYHL